LLWELDLFGAGTELNATDIFLLRLNLSGYITGQPTTFRQFGFGVRNRNPDAVYATRTNELFVAAEIDDPNSITPDSDIPVIAFSAVNLGLDAFVAQINSGQYVHNEHSPAVAYNSRLGELLTVWFDGNHTEAPYGGRSDRKRSIVPQMNPSFAKDEYEQIVTDLPYSMDILSSSKSPFDRTFVFPEPTLEERQAVQSAGPTSLVGTVLCTDTSSTTGISATSVTSSATATSATSSASSATSATTTSGNPRTSVSETATTEAKTSSAARMVLSLFIAVLMAAALV